MRLKISQSSRLWAGFTGNARTAAIAMISKISKWAALMVCGQDGPDPEDEKNSRPKPEGVCPGGNVGRGRGFVKGRTTTLRIVP